MANLETEYLGLKLKNPIIISSSGLTNSVDKIVELEKAGAGAVILKSMFEEQILFETTDLLKHNEYPEAEDYILAYARENTLNHYIDLLKSAKSKVNIPIIASINCVSDKDWKEFAKDLEEAGADALELNIYPIPTDKHKDANYYENVYFDIVKNIKAAVSIPIAVKIGKSFANLINVVDKLDAYGADSVVLFNRFYEPDIDIDAIKLTNADVFSNPGEIRSNLRWIAMISGKTDVQISSSTGVHSGEDAVKMLLAGATSVQICSAVYKNGNSIIPEILKFITEWMDKKNFKDLPQFRGKMNYKTIPNPSVYERSQFMRYFSSVE